MKTTIKSLVLIFLSSIVCCNNNEKKIPENSIYKKGDIVYKADMIKVVFSDGKIEDYSKLKTEKGFIYFEIIYREDPDTKKFIIDDKLNLIISKKESEPIIIKVNKNVIYNNIECDEYQTYNMGVFYISKDSIMQSFEGKPAIQFHIAERINY